MMASAGKAVFVMVTMERSDPLKIRAAILDTLGR